MQAQHQQSEADGSVELFRYVLGSARQQGTIESRHTNEIHDATGVRVKLRGRTTGPAAGQRILIGRGLPSTPPADLEAAESMAHDIIIAGFFVRPAFLPFSFCFSLCRLLSYCFKTFWFGSLPFVISFIKFKVWQWLALPSCLFPFCFSLCRLLSYCFQNCLVRQLIVCNFLHQI